MCDFARFIYKLAIIIAKTGTTHQTWRLTSFLKINSHGAPLIPALKLATIKQHAV